MSLSTIISSKLIEILDHELLKYAPEIQDAAVEELKVIFNKLLTKLESISMPTKGDTQ